MWSNICHDPCISALGIEIDPIATHRTLPIVHGAPLLKEKYMIYISRKGTEDHYGFCLRNNNWIVSPPHGRTE